MPYARLVSMARMLSWATVVLAGCDPSPAPLDASADALDTASDGGCTGVPGVLEGERAIRAGALLPDLAFTTEGEPTSLARFHTPCEARVIVLRSMTAWSGPSAWHAAHTARLRAEPRVTIVDLLTEGADALPAESDDLASFRARYDVPPDALAIDPEDRLAPLAFGGVRLPLVAIVDARDLRVVRLLFAPHAGETEYEVQVALAAIEGRARPPLPSKALVDGRFTEDAWDLIRGMRWAPPGEDRSNAVADDVTAAGVGATFFEDAGLSPTGVGCASCHRPDLAFTDGRPVGRGVGDVTRNTPTLFGAAHTRWPFWDGRTDSLWAQALGPMESPLEMGSSRLYVAHRVFDVHRRSYEAVFGSMPDVSDLGRFPASGLPGEPAYDAMSADDRDTVTRIAVNVSKAMAAFERTLSPPETAFDRYLEGDMEALTSTERDGLALFVETACIQCHHGPTLSDDAFHNIRMPGSVAADLGRLAALGPLLASPFRRQGVYSDDETIPDPLSGIAALPERTRGAFRTPPLRALSSTGPYGHGGTFATLREVVVHYATVRGTPSTDDRVVGALDPHVPGFENVEERVAPLTAFLETL
jgi:cytochrome c peroxidase